MKTCIINQFAGLGDIIFLIPIARKYINDGYHIVWPVISEYVEIGRHFPEIEFVDKNMYHINYEKMKRIETENSIIIPFRWSNNIMKVEYKRCMEAKYTMEGLPLSMWRESSWIRNSSKENELFGVLGIKEGDEYTIINDEYSKAKIKINVETNMKTIKMKVINGYTLFDWGKVIENASIIHTVGTSINYIIELLPIKASQIHLYIRHPQEKNFDNYDYLLTKNYTFHI